MIFTVPIRTVSALNMREHWAKKAKRVKQERNVTAIAAYAQDWSRDGGPPIGEYSLKAEAGESLSVTLTRIAPRQLDDDNLRGALKGVRDEVAAMLGVDDRDPVVRWQYAQRKGKPKEWAVEVRIEEARQTRQDGQGDTQRAESGERRIPKTRTPQALVDAHDTEGEW